MFHVYSEIKIFAQESKIRMLMAVATFFTARETNQSAYVRFFSDCRWSISIHSSWFNRRLDCFSPFLHPSMRSETIQYRSALLCVGIIHECCWLTTSPVAPAKRKKGLLYVTSSSVFSRWLFCLFFLRCSAIEKQYLLTFINFRYTRLYIECWRKYLSKSRLDVCSLWRQD